MWLGGDDGGEGEPFEQPDRTNRSKVKGCVGQVNLVALEMQCRLGSLSGC